MKPALVLLGLLALTASASAQVYGPPLIYPDPREWGPEEQRRRLPRDDYGPFYTDEDYRRYGPPRERLSPQEYERRAFCAMHPEECQ
jgi:hypothetical protein